MLNKKETKGDFWNIEEYLKTTCTRKCARNATIWTQKQIML